jgi:2-amino-4-hydroxy-6-hydroxymethyldihydropteridine diphosphokinase
LPRTTLVAFSPLYRSAPIDAIGPDFLNAAALLETRLEPLALLGALQGIEAEHGRERPHRNAPRTLDLDVLLFGDQLIALPSLAVPHPRLHERAFALLPLADVWPDAVIPGRGPLGEWLPRVADQRIEKLPP